jgi:glycerophosphoryl diester phosphodiesterase
MMESTSALTPESARDHLRAVIDPEIYQNIIDLGLVYDVHVDEANAVDVKMTLTSPQCPLGPEIVQNVEKVLAAKGASDVRVQIVWEPRWTPDAMTDDLKRELGILEETIEDEGPQLVPEPKPYILLTLKPQKEQRMARRVQVFAHRGAKLAAPENTLPAFQKALDMGADGIELDVQCSKDGALMILHDFTLDHTTNGHGLLKEFSAAELAALDAGSHFSPDFAGTRIPTLEQIFDLVGSRCRINVEIKSQEPDGGREVDLVAALVKRRKLYDQVIISSFNPLSLIRMRWTDSRIALGYLYYQPVPDALWAAWFASLLKPEAIHPHHALVDEELIAFAHANDCAVNVWTVNDVPEAQRLADLGVNVIMTDAPDRMLAALDEG